MADLFKFCLQKNSVQRNAHFYFNLKFIPILYILLQYREQYHMTPWDW